jgi:hypothetical protein
VKLRIVLLVLVGAAGVGASIALADSGKHGRHADTSTATTGTSTTPSCQRAAVVGTASPQTFTVTVKKVGPHSSLAPGQVVTVTVGGAGQTVWVGAAGCLTGSSLAARGAEVRAVSTKPTTTTSTTTSTTSTGTTTTTQGHGDGKRHHHRGHH